MTDADFSADCARRLAEEIRIGKLAYMQTREYADEAVRQEVRSQRGAIFEFAQYWQEREARRRERAVEDEDLHNDNRRF